MKFRFLCNPTLTVLFTLLIVAIPAVSQHAKALRTAMASADNESAVASAMMRAPSVPLAYSERRVEASSSYSKLPINFEKNDGQVDSRVDFIGRARGYLVALSKADAEVRFQSQTHNNSDPTLHLRLSGANPNPIAVGLDLMPGKANYISGSDSRTWRTNIPVYGRVRYEEVYDGVDLIYRGSPEHLEYDFVIKPGAAPACIKLNFDGAESISSDGNGGLRLRLAGETVHQLRPKIYQIVNGRRRAVSGAFVIRPDRSVSFQVGRYDRRSVLIIDPVLLYSTFLGGMGQDVPTGVAVDSSGDTYIVGYTQSFDFPTTEGTYQSIAPWPEGTFGGQGIFVAKLNAAGTALLYSTFIAGNAVNATSVAVDAQGNAVIAGGANPVGFPVTDNAYKRDPTGWLEGAYLTKLNSNGSGLLYSTVLPGTGQATAVALDSAGNAYFTGSAGFRVPTTANVPQPTAPGRSDGFLAKIDFSKVGDESLAFATYVGGSGEESGLEIDVSSSGEPYVTGITTSTDFPTTSGAYQRELRSNFACTSGPCPDVFAVRYSVDGSRVIYATLLGGTGAEKTANIAVDAAGNAYIAGATESGDFPLANPYQSDCGRYAPEFCAAQRAFVSKLNPEGSALVYSTYLGGRSAASGSAGSDFAYAIAVDNAGFAYVTGATQSSDFPVLGETFLQGSCATSNGCADVFVTKFSPDGKTLAYSTVIGGNPDSQRGIDIAVDGQGNAYVVGDTSALFDFPISAGAVQPTYSGGATDGFVLKLAAGSPTGQPSILGVQPRSGGDHGFATIVITGGDFATGSIAKLVRGQTELTGQDCYIAGNQQSITCGFDLRGAQQGAWDVSVESPSGTTATSAAAFDVESTVNPRIWVDIVGAPVTSTNRPTILHIVVGNRGNVDAFAVPVWISVPKGTAIKLPQVLEFPDAPFPIDANTVPIGLETDGGMMIPLLVSRVPAEAIADPITVELLPVTTGTLNISVWANAPYLAATESGTANALTLTPQGESAVRTAASILQLVSPNAPIPVQDVQVCALKMANFALQQLSIEILGEVIGNGSKCVQDFYSTVIALYQYLSNAPSFGPASRKPVPNNWIWVNAFATVKSCLEAAVGVAIPEATLTRILLKVLLETSVNFIDTPECRRILDRVFQSDFQMQVVASKDPNGKSGRSGSGTARYLQGEEAVAYVVTFENEPDATAPAQRVVITDELDLTKFEIGTFGFGPIYFGDKVISPPPGVSDFTDRVDLRPELNLIVEIEATLEKNTGLVTWTFNSLDPDTVGTPENPLVGFLPPDRNPPEGLGGVMFYLRPKAALATGTTIENKASIIFDANEAIHTDTWLNTIDHSGPVSKVNPLPPTQDAAQFRVEWSGSDDGSGIRDYTIFMSEDDGEFSVWQSRTLLTSSLFSGVPGHKYAFFSVAEDRVGNQESLKSAAEATTTLAADTLPPHLNCSMPDTNWHGGDVAIDCTAIDEQSGLANPSDASFSLSTSVLAGEETANAKTDSRDICDVVGNCTVAGPIGSIKVDKKAPLLTITAPLSTDYILRSTVIAKYSCFDQGSLVATCSGTTANGVGADTDTVGNESFIVTARDNVGNSSSSEVAYRVVYAFSGFSSPIPNSTFSAGRSIPVKFRLADANGAIVTDAKATLQVFAVSSGSPQPMPVMPAGTSNSGTAFRFDPKEKQYVYDLSTSGYPRGTYVLRALPGDGTTRDVQIQLK